jgi:complement component 4
MLAMDIAALDYLRSMDLSYKFENIRGSLLTGYQQILGKKNDDGSFSLWNEEGSARVWLTAYVVKLLSVAQNYIPISEETIRDALNYIVRQQIGDGSFLGSYNGYSIHSKSQEGIPLTAFCAIALLENKYYKSRYQEHINRALAYIKSKAPRNCDIYYLAISAYALALNKDKIADEVLNELKSNAIINDDQMFWYQQPKAFHSNDPPSVNVEIASYALMAFVERNRIGDGVKVMNWLKTQWPTGEFQSQTDTMIDLQAMVKLAKALHVPQTNFKVTINNGISQGLNFDINQQNAIEPQLKVLDKDTREIQVDVKGKGIAFVQVSYRYHSAVQELIEGFAITAVPTVTGNVLKIKICASFIEDDRTQSGLTSVEVNLPSGYVYDPQTAEMVKAVNVRVSRPKSLKCLVTYSVF